MSRRKTIEDAVDRAEIKWGQDSYRVINAVTRAAAYGYDLGRIAGLREAAQMVPLHGAFADVAIRSKASALDKKL